MENKIEMSQGANDGLREMMEMVQDAVRDSLDALRNNDRDLAIKVIEQDDRIDVMEVELRKGHISRLNAGACSAGAGAVYLDILSNLERIGDHAVNLAQEVLDQHRKTVKNDN